jgi:hypothetical protein
MMLLVFLLLLVTLQVGLHGFFGTEVDVVVSLGAIFLCDVGFNFYLVLELCSGLWLCNFGSSVVQYLALYVSFETIIPSLALCMLLYFISSCSFLSCLNSLSNPLMVVIHYLLLLLHHFVSSVNSPFNFAIGQDLLHLMLHGTTTSPS